MKKIIHDGINKMEGYAELKQYEHFIYADGSYEFFAIKYNDNYSILINGCNKFIVAYAYPNLLSIGTGHITEFDTFDEAEDFLKKGE